MTVRRPFAFLDRDGTLNREQSFVTTPDELVVLPGARAAVTALDDAGFRIVVVTNQSGIARGLYDEATLARIHAKLHDALDRRPLAYLHCPHLPEATGPYGGACECRKPAGGMLESAVATFGGTLSGAFVVGDAGRDVGMAATAPLRRILVRSGKDWRHELQVATGLGVAPDAVVDDVRAAADWILATLR